MYLVSSHCEANQENCVSCHTEQVKQWLQSDHAKSMATADPDNVLANFNDVEITHYSQKAKFYRSKDKFLIDLTEAGTTNTYEVIYTFGHYPLQQYLVPAPNGKYQVFPFAWDSREQNEGGQRWYPNHPAEDIGINDRLHWKQPMQNWNGMCADCHSTGLKRNFDNESLSFNSQFDNINVSCASCHGDMTNHYIANKTQRPEILLKTPNLLSGLSSNDIKAVGKWLFKKGDKIASWHEEIDGKYQPAKRDNNFMESCFGCHSLRSPLTNGINPEQTFLDQFTPSFLMPPLYFADGQIHEEVFVYGSFLQSRMYEAGVNCIDCHNPHTMKVKVEGNGLCLQCHAANTYDGIKHTKHPSNSEASQCVNCHMPTRTYMGVDARRDHSFSIPSPRVSEKTDAPNACINCHEKSNAWVAEQLSKWYGRDSTLIIEEEQYIAFIHGEKFTKAAILKLLQAKSLPIIKRATLLAILPSRIEALTDSELRPFILSEEPLLRLAVAQAGRALPPRERLKTYPRLLEDEYKAIRVAAANNLVGLGISSSSYKNALSELTASNAISQWRGEGNLNQSLIEYEQGNIEQAETLLKQGTIVDPYFEANYINLAELYRSQNLMAKEESVLEKALSSMPKSDLIHYSIGMFNIRKSNKTKAVFHFKKATELNPSNVQNWYIYALALDNTGQIPQSIEALKKGLSYQKDASLIDLGLSLSQKLGDQGSFSYFMKLKNSH
ncbi:ammonia-forming cytochrome c nitrite reductase subunit c552 [Rheinheimera sp. UJ51]|uniref:ammonia-forming cytochrome c nitrite reductase subunit c552 n=1 Tax=Rheinheimera sp. UJ51 TaxID=2892446 RepID=UPI00226EE0DF|nr:ammonia-forming cytochrome c nitrite reductase subunit c552 [Rheinheimera sp. UJ51]MCC5453291.1 ammonia-forming cytochrome c nitrite reductase subunit c552 [Rheinheimera sp. UJ51]